MARLNVDEEWWSDPRRLALVLLVGSQSGADGAMLNAWHLSQHFWIKKERSLVPLEMWKNLEHGEAIVKAGLAEMREEGVYVKGNTRHDELLKKIEQRSEANATGGKARAAQAQRGKRGRFEKSEPEIDQRSTSDSPAATSDPPGATRFSYSFSSSSSKKEERETRARGDNSGIADKPAQALPIDPLGKTLTHPVRREHVDKAVGEWRITLQHLDREGKVYPNADAKIWQAMVRFGHEMVTDAIIGARYEKPGEKFDPREWCSLDRVLSPKNIERFANNAQIARRSDPELYEPDPLDPSFKTLWRG